MSAQTTYPLAWPAHKPRTPETKRRWGTFKVADQYISRSAAIKRVHEEVRRLGGQHVVISTAVPIRRDGQPYRNRSAEPTDPGCVVFFHMKGKPYTMACDTFTNLDQNIAGVAAHIEATRKIERYGVATAAETLQAFTALPPPSSGPGAAPTRPWWEVFGVVRDAADQATIFAIDRLKAKAAGQDEAALLELNLARDAALRDIDNA